MGGVIFLRSGLHTLFVFYVPKHVTALQGVRRCCTVVLSSSIIYVKAYILPWGRGAAHVGRPGAWRGDSSEHAPGAPHVPWNRACATFFSLSLK